jgi:drug/metabolite transporter (DMT)-like permease
MTDLPAPVMAAVLAAALLHAAWNALLKASPDKDLENAALALARMVLGLLVLPWVAAPAPAAWPWIAASVVIHIAYFWSLAGAYRHGDLSFTYPIMRGGAPVLVAVASAALFGEVPGVQQAAAIALVCAGVLAFAVRPAGAGAAPSRALGFALANACVIACYTLVDAQGVRVSGSAFGYVAWLLLLNGAVQAGIGASTRGHAVVRHAIAHGPRVLAGAACTIASYAIALWAMTRAPVAAVAALRESSVVFAAAIGVLFLGEALTPRRVMATALVAAGLVLMRI